MLAQVQPDLVLLDVLMPGIDGLVVLERIKEQDQRVPVLMLTATKTVKTAVTAMKLGAFDYVTKPFDVEELLIIVERATRDAARNAELENLRWEVEDDLARIVGDAPAREIGRFGKAVARAIRDAAKSLDGFARREPFRR